MFCGESTRIAPVLPDRSVPAVPFKDAAISPIYQIFYFVFSFAYFVDTDYIGNNGITRAACIYMKTKFIFNLPVIIAPKTGRKHLCSIFTLFLFVAEINLDMTF